MHFRIPVRAIRALVTLHVKRGLVVMVTAVFVLTDMKESFAKEVRKETPRHGRSSSPRFIVKVTQ